MYSKTIEKCIVKWYNYSEVKSNELKKRRLQRTFD